MYFLLCSLPPLCHVIKRYMCFNTLSNPFHKSCNMKVNILPYLIRPKSHHVPHPCTHHKVHAKALYWNSPVKKALQASLRKKLKNEKTTSQNLSKLPCNKLNSNKATCHTKMGRNLLIICIIIITITTTTTPTTIFSSSFTYLFPWLSLFPGCCSPLTSAGWPSFSLSPATGCRPRRDRTRADRTSMIVSV